MNAPWQDYAEGTISLDRYITALLNGGTTMPRHTPQTVIQEGSICRQCIHLLQTDMLDTYRESRSFAQCALWNNALAISAPAQITECTQFIAVAEARPENYVAYDPEDEEDDCEEDE